MRWGTVRFLKHRVGVAALAAALLVVAPAAAFADGTIVVKAGADRTATDSDAGHVAPLAGAAFEIAADAAGPYTPLCTTAGPDGACDAQVADGTWFVRPASAPAGYRALRDLDLPTSPRAYRAQVTVAAGTVTAVPETAPAAAERFVFARENPALPAGCPIDLALLLDRSGSMNSQKASYRAAALRLIDRLEGTPTRLDVLSVAASAVQESAATLDLSVPADVQTARDLVTAAYAAPSGSTNYDAGFRLAATTGADATVFVTDGEPASARGWSDDGELLDVTAAIAAANAAKAAGTAIYAVAGSANVGLDSLTALAAPGAVFAGALPTLESSVDAAADALSATRCAARISVRKLVAGNAQAGWTFAASAGAGAVASFPGGPVTAGSPPATSVLVAGVPAGGAALTLTETPRDGLALQSAECRTGGFDGAPVTTSATANGLVLGVTRGGTYSCTFVNAPPDAGPPPSVPAPPAGLPVPLLAAPGDCLTNPGCAPGLKRTYGVDVSSVLRPLDAAGAGVEALDQGLAQVAVVFSTNPEIARSDLLVLRDDKGMIGPENLVPVIRRGTLRALGPRRAREARRRLAAVSQVLTTGRLQDLNLALADGRDPEAVAGEFLETFRIAGGRPPARGPRIVIGHQDFDEQEIVASLYARALRAAGLRASAQRVGATGKLLERLRANRIQAFVAYTSTLLQTLEPGARPSRAGTAAALRRAVTRRLGARALEPAPGQNANAFVMKREAARAYGVRRLSDLTRRWPVAR
jgi:glycine betaine/choline ABC-type transport system substrate-binding protein